MSAVKTTWEFACSSCPKVLRTTERALLAELVLEHVWQSHPARYHAEQSQLLAVLRRFILRGVER